MDLDGLPVDEAEFIYAVATGYLPVNVPLLSPTELERRQDAGPFVLAWIRMMEARSDAEQR